MRIFIAGATGVVGTRVVPMLLSAGHSVTAIGRTEEKRAALAQRGANAIAASLFDREMLHRVIADHDVVVNLATAIPAPSKALLPGAWRETARIRRVGSANLVAAAKEARAIRFIQESFAPIYEDAGDAWIDESSAVRPARYNHAVVDAEEAAASFGGAGRAAVILRFAFFYGPDSGFLRDMIARVRKGRAPAFRPDTYMSSISHDDAASAVVAALHIPAGIYNVVDDEPVTKREFFRALAATLEVPEPAFPPSWLYHLLGSLGETVARSQRMSNRKLRDASTWAPKYPSVREGLRDAITKRRRS